MSTSTATQKLLPTEAAQFDAESRARQRRVLTVISAHLTHDSYAPFLPALLPKLIEIFALSKTQAGLLQVFMSSPSLLQPIIGHTSDRVDLRYAVILAPAITGVAMSLIGVAPSYAALAILLVISGTVSAGMHAVGTAMVGDLSGTKLGRGIGFWMVGGEIGYATGGILAVAVVSVLGMRGTPWLMITGLVASAFLFRQLKDSPYIARQNAGTLPILPALRAMSPILLPVSIVIVLRAFLESALTVYLPTYVIDQGGSLWLGGSSLTLLEIAGMVGLAVAGSLSDRLGRRTVLFASLAVTPVLMLGFLSVTGGARLLVLVLMGVSLFAAGPVLMALLQESFPENRAMASGLYMAVGFAIRSGVVLAVGALSDYYGMHQAFLISAVVSLGAVPLLFLVPAPRRPPGDQASTE